MSIDALHVVLRVRHLFVLYYIILYYTILYYIILKHFQIFADDTKTRESGAHNRA